MKGGRVRVLNEGRVIIDNDNDFIMHNRVASKEVVASIRGNLKWNVRIDLFR